jgi:hypothetical protein
LLHRFLLKGMFRRDLRGSLEEPPPVRSNHAGHVGRHGVDVSHETPP